MNVTVETRRWADIEIGDVVLDPRWCWQRWQRIERVEHRDGDRTEAWWGANASKERRGYQVGSLELVEVQVVLDG